MRNRNQSERNENYFRRGPEQRRDQRRGQDQQFGQGRYNEGRYDQGRYRPQNFERTGWSSGSYDDLNREQRYSGGQGYRTGREHFEDDRGDFESDWSPQSRAIGGRSFDEDRFASSWGAGNQGLQYRGYGSERNYGSERDYGASRRQYGAAGYGSSEREGASEFGGLGRTELGRGGSYQGTSSGYRSGQLAGAAQGRSLYSSGYSGSMYSGSSIGTAESFYGRGPKGYTRSDERIREDVSDALYADEDVDASELAVTVKDGEVTLSGSIETRRMKHLAENIADSVPGVKDVRNELRVTRGLMSQIAEKVQHGVDRITGNESRHEQRGSPANNRNAS